MSYRELAPPPELAALVRCAWTRTGTSDDALVLPDGCIDVIVRDGQAQVAGPDTRPVHVPLGRGDVVAGVRLRPGTAGAVLGVPADELRDRRVELEALWGRVGRELGERAGSDPLALLSALRDRLVRTAPDARAIAAARRLAAAPATPLPALATTVALGERQLRRRFAAAVGYGPKTFARIVRFRRALALLYAGEPPAAAAYAAGYADQAHLTRELRALAGRTPGALSAERLRQPDAAVVGDRPARVVGDLPGVAIGVAEHA